MSMSPVVVDVVGVRLLYGVEIPDHRMLDPERAVSGISAGLVLVFPPGDVVAGLGSPQNVHVAVFVHIRRHDPRRAGKAAVRSMLRPGLPFALGIFEPDDVAVAVGGAYDVRVIVAVDVRGANAVKAQAGVDIGIGPCALSGSGIFQPRESFVFEP